MNRLIFENEKESLHYCVPAEIAKQGSDDVL